MVNSAGSGTKPWNVKKGLPDCRIIPLLKNARPIHGDELGLDSDLAKVLGGNERCLIDEVILLAGDDAEAFTLVSGLIEQLLRPCEIFAIERIRAGIRHKGRRSLIETGVNGEASPGCRKPPA